jgi:uncharacterized membrane protein
LTTLDAFKAVDSLLVYRTSEVLTAAELDPIANEVDAFWAAADEQYSVAATGKLRAVVVSLGFVMLIIPGIILALLTLWFVVDKNMGVVDSIMASVNATKGSLGDLFIFALVAVVLSVVGSIPCGLGLLIVVPLLSVATAHIYEALTKTEGETASVT